MNGLVDHIIAKIVLGQIRHYVGMAGTALVSKGLLTQDQGTQLVGAVMMIVPLVLSAWDKWQAQQKQDAAVLAAAKKGN